jgi:Golgi nucleoside diphosphatase
MRFAEETREFYQLSEIEKVINDNKDKINNYN